ncbi:hypothetical protein [Geothrix edaphica]|nr:hypothetical protein [Geothrix edaphica]
MNGKQIGDDYARTLARYLEALRAEGKGVPSRDGKVSAKAVALASGVDLQSIYKNIKCRAILEAAAQELGLAPMGTREAGPTKDDAKDRRIQTLETRNAALQAEVEGLRQKLRRYQHIEQHMVETGRRVIP